MNSTQEKIRDSRQYRDRTNLSVSNANLFISNNANPFLISPYSPPANLVRESQLNSINIAISSAIQNLSTIVDLNTWALKICTITNSPYYPDVTISTNNIFIKGTNEIVMDSPDIYIDGFAQINNISTGNIFASIGNFSTLAASSFVIDDEIVLNSIVVNSTITGSTLLSNNISTGNIFGSIGNFSTLTASSFLTNSLTVESTLIASTLLSNNISTGNITFDTLSGNSIVSNSLTVQSTLVVSSINAASSIITNEFIFSSLCMIPSSFSSLVTATSSIVICMNGEFWGIPVGQF